MNCTHNEMHQTGDPLRAWQCARCGYIYGEGQSQTYRGWRVAFLQRFHAWSATRAGVGMNNATYDGLTRMIDQRQK